MGKRNTDKSKQNNIDAFKKDLNLLFSKASKTIEKGLQHDRNTTFRIVQKNNNEQKVKEDLKNEGYEIQPGPIENSFEITKMPEKKHISDTESFKNGWIYVQEFASMLPPLVLDLKDNGADDNFKILDMASAPGSKTTQIADITNYKSEILALEKSPIRIQKLKHNLRIYKCDNVKTLLANGIKFDKRNPQFTEYFDRVLVDAPCSSEGRFNLKDPKSYKYWNIKKRKEMSKAQKGLLLSGVRMLKPGGTLVYSTCTFGVEENELVLNWLLEKMPELKIEKIDFGINNQHHGLTTIKKDDKSIELNNQIKNAVRILPNEQFGGFFIAKIKKA